MAVNHADGAFFVSVLFYPITAVKAADSAGADWFAVFFIPLGLATGLAVTYVGRKFLYAVMRAVLKRTEASRTWIQYAVGAPMLLFYLIFPFGISGAGLCATWFGSIWIVRHIA